MRGLIRIGRLAIVAGVATMGACAPVTFAGAGTGLQLGLSPRGPASFGLQSCTLTGSQSPSSLSTSAAAMAMSRNQQIAQIQSRYMLGASSPEAKRSSWKRLATGEC